MPSVDSFCLLALQGPEMSDDVTFVTSRAFHLDDIPYSISVYRNHEGFTAFCDCHKCENHNMRSNPQSDRDSAITECENHIRQHHADVHTAAVSA